MPVTDLNGGAGAGSATYWRGDGTLEYASRGGQCYQREVAVAADSAGVVSWSGSPITASGTLTPTFSQATSSQFGVVKVDGSTITASGGVISAAGGGGSLSTNELVATAPNATTQVSIANPVTPLGFLSYNGFSNVWDTPDTAVAWRDEFMGGCPAQQPLYYTYGFGDLNWGFYFTYGDCFLEAATGVGLYPNHPGELELSATGNTVCAGNLVKNYPGQASGAFEHACMSYEYIEWDVLLYTTLPASPNIFYTATGVSDVEGNYPADGLWFQMDSFSTNHIECVSAVGSVYHTNWLSAVPTVQQKWYKFGIQWLQNSNVIFSINHTNYYTNSTLSQIPSSTMLWAFDGMGVTATGGSGTPLQIIDYCAFYQRLGTNSAWGVYGR